MINLKAGFVSSVAILAGLGFGVSAQAQPAVA